MGMGRSFWGPLGRAREQFLWGWGDRSTTGERGSSSYGDGEIVPPLGSEGAVLMGSSYGEIVPPLGSEGAVLMGMGRSFHHWGARVEKLCSRDERKAIARLAGWARRPVAAERSGRDGV